MMSIVSLEPAFLQEALSLAFESGVKLEMVGGIPTWEALPSPRHQIVLKAIEKSVTPPVDESQCGCHCYQDTYVSFPDGSFKRPDLAIYCTPLPPTDSAATQTPVAVVEVLSPGYEAKDIQIGAPFYISQGVLDVVLVDPRRGEGTHQTAEMTTKFESPALLKLKCGCQVTV